MYNYHESNATNSNPSVAETLTYFDIVYCTLRNTIMLQCHLYCQKTDSSQLLNLPALDRKV